ncbi:anthranilate synthase beta subunit 2, chloroplastic-like protein isoform X1 [Tanacetum coccineum]
MMVLSPWGSCSETYGKDTMKNPRGILVSPGPGAPHDLGISLQTILELGLEVPLFGVCMGLQSIGKALGCGLF